MNDRCGFIKSTAILLTGVLILSSMPAHASGVGSVNGHVLLSPQSAPMEGARVLLSNTRTGEIYASPASGSDGAFSLDGIAPGTYRVAVQSDAGLYAVASPLTVAPDQSASIHLAVKDAKEGTEPMTPAADQGKKKKAGSWWDNPLTASLVVVGAAVVVGVIVDQSSSKNETASVSPSAP